MMTIYIAGKVTGLPPQKVEKNFSETSKIIESFGYKVENPVLTVNDPNCEWTKAMRMCIARMMLADAVYLLPNWKQSKGATIEKQLAEQFKIPVFESIWCLNQFFRNR